MACEQAEHLVLIAFNKSDVGAGCAVEHGTEAISNLPSSEVKVHGSMKAFSSPGMLNFT